MVWDWPPAFFRLYIPRLIERGYLTAADEAEYWRDVEARSVDPAAYLATPPMVDIVAEKP